MYLFFFYLYTHCVYIPLPQTWTEECVLSVPVMLGGSVPSRCGDRGQKSSVSLSGFSPLSRSHRQDCWEEPQDWHVLIFTCLPLHFIPLLQSNPTSTVCYFPPSSIAPSSIFVLLNSQLHLIFDIGNCFHIMVCCLKWKGNVSPGCLCSFPSVQFHVLFFNNSCLRHSRNSNDIINNIHNNGSQP